MTEPAHLPTRHRDRLCAVRSAFACLVLACLASCATDKEYAQKLVNARTEWKGSEIVGVWVSKLHYMGPLSMRVTLLLRPDGTGREISRAPAGNHFECDINWHYSGGGVWSGSGEGVEIMDAVSVPLNHSNFVIHYNGSELLLKDLGNMTGGHRYSMVFVRADDEAAVEEHLKKR